MSENYIRWIIPLTVFLLITILETFFPLFKKRSKRWLHGARNISIFLLNSVLIRFIFLGITVRILILTEQRELGLFHFSKISGWAGLILIFMLFDVWMYIWHRLNHTVKFFWRFHRMHHSDTAMDVTTALRFHFVELFLSSILRLVVFVLLGMPAYLLVWYEIVMMVIIYFQHSNILIPYRIDRFLHTIIVTPWMHWVHHSKIQSETDSNYGTIFSFWDRIGRSFKIRKDPYNIIYGLEYFRDEKSQTFMGMLMTPFVRHQ